jgi:hypothetical protein
MTPEKPAEFVQNPSGNQRFSDQIQGLPENSTWNILKPIILGNEMPNKYMKTCENKFCTGFRNVPDIFSINQKRKYSRTHVDHKPPPSSYKFQWWLDPVGYWSCWSSIRHLCLKPLEVAIKQVLELAQQVGKAAWSALDHSMNTQVKENQDNSCLPSWFVFVTFLSAPKPPESTWIHFPAQHPRRCADSWRPWLWLEPSDLPAPNQPRPPPWQSAKNIWWPGVILCKNRQKYYNHL